MRVRCGQGCGFDAHRIAQTGKFLKGYWDIFRIQCRAPAFREKPLQPRAPPALSAESAADRSAGRSSRQSQCCAFRRGQGERHVVRCGGVAQPGGLGFVHRHMTLPLPIRSPQAKRILPSVPVCAETV